jgi:hypothetical protein
MRHFTAYHNEQRMGHDHFESRRVFAGGTRFDWLLRRSLGSPLRLFSGVAGPTALFSGRRLFQLSQQFYRIEDPKRRETSPEILAFPSGGVRQHE